MQTYEVKMTAAKVEKKKTIQPAAFGLYHLATVALAVARVFLIRLTLRFHITEFTLTLVMRASAPYLAPLTAIPFLRVLTRFFSGSQWPSGVF